ncbi:MAG TPA: lysylphosphatidylglycerol synthase transmembrane domain-containing protein [Candidatus Sulfotelmatobacter sp.]
MTSTERLDTHRKAPRGFFRSFVLLLGVSLLGYMVFRAGPGAVWKQVQAVGWGLALIIIMGGFSQLIKTCAWRQTFACDISALSWSRSLGAQLVSDAVGQLGFAGKLFGEGLRISMLGSAVPLANGISSSAIDGGLHAFTAVVVTVLGITATLLLAPVVDGRWRIYALLLAGVLIAIVAISAVAVASGWRLMGNTARAIGRLPRLHKLVSDKLSVIDSAEQNLLSFCRKEPVAFCASLILNFLWHAMAVLEVYLILRFMGADVAVVGAFAMEGLTKVINLVGALSPGNLGTYEGGNMLIANLFGVTGTAGLTLALCRRVRSIFWAAVGATYMIVTKRGGSTNTMEVKGNDEDQSLHRACSRVAADSTCH